MLWKKTTELLSFFGQEKTAGTDNFSGPWHQLIHSHVGPHFLDVKHSKASLTRLASCPACPGGHGTGDGHGMAWSSLVVAHVLEPCHLAVHHIHLTSLENFFGQCLPMTDPAGAGRLMLTWLGYIDGKIWDPCYHIWHTWILWVWLDLHRFTAVHHISQHLITSYHHSPPHCLSVPTECSGTEMFWAVPKHCQEKMCTIRTIYIKKLLGMLIIWIESVCGIERTQCLTLRSYCL